MFQKIVSSSFRDPSGVVFFSNGQIFRQVNKCYSDIYEKATECGLFSFFHTKKQLVYHIESTDQVFISDDGYKIIKPEILPFISYPYEWSFSQLKDAALLTLEMQIAAINRGFSLKDASAYNVQFFNGKPIFIDTLSFEIYQKEKPWIAYGQFCRHFLAPLALMSLGDVRCCQLLKSNIDGIPLDLAVKLLPFKARFRKGLLLHLFLHAATSQKYESTIDTYKNSKKRALKMSSQGLLGILDNLKGSIESLQWKPSGTQWADYYNQTNYTDEATLHKQNLVKDFLVQAGSATVWDVGANDGRYSRIAAELGANVVAFDIDPSAVEKNYLQCKVSASGSMLPLCMDLTNPTPALGWNNRERSDFASRGPADVVMALALIHHLAIGNNVPLNMISDFFASICKNLIIEFVSKEDSQILRLLANREDVFGNYTEVNFEKAFQTNFTIISKVAIAESKRVLYFMKKK